MSGLEPVAALGLACNILQVVGVGRETVQLAKQVYQDGALDPALTESAGILDNLASQIPSATPGTPMTKPNASDKQLLNLAQKCQGAARDLREEVNFLNGQPTRAKLAATLKIAAKTTWRKRRLEKLDQKLKEAESLLQTGLLARINERIEKTNSDLSSLKEDVRAFYNNYCQNHAKAIDLTKKHITAETKRSEEAVKFHVTHISGQTEKHLEKHIAVAMRNVIRLEQDSRLEVRRERLLRSLKFDRMNERRNQVSPSHPRTFSWMLRDGSDDDDDGSQGTTDISDDEDDYTWDSFSDWLRSTETMYWVSGKPGSGKTTLIKYLIGHTKTKKYLDLWRHDAMIISHFFWRPGTAMQQSIKGLLCSLLYQLLLEDPPSTDEMLRNNKDNSNKDTETDWSCEELQSTLHEVVSHYPRPMAIFLDGLDEVLPKDGVLRLLEVIEKLKEQYGQAGKVKICLGSRRELLLCKGLHLYPQLRLECLNRNDLRQYGIDHIVIPPDYNITMPTTFKLYRSSGQRRPPSRDEIKEKLVGSLVAKAEGVFLWLCLTVTTITKALNEGEAFEDVERRIDNLPRDLADLYSDMWDRMNHDSDHLRVRAASYLQLALVDTKDYDWEYPLNPFIMMVATTPGIADKIFKSNSCERISAASLIEYCEATRRETERRCAGLLSCPSPTEVRVVENEVPLSPWYGEEYKSLIPYVSKFPAYSLLHRTAQDFLIDTEMGQRILSYSSFTEDHAWLKLVEARLAICQLFSWPDEYTDLTGVHRNHNELLVALMALFDKQYDESSWAELSRLLLRCEQLFNSGCLCGQRTVPSDSTLLEEDPRSEEYYFPRESTVNREHEFLMETAKSSQYYATVWNSLLPVVESRNLSENTMSQLLICACCLNIAFNAHTGILETRMTAIETCMTATQALLDWGASPRSEGLQWTFVELFSPEITSLVTTFKALIMGIWNCTIGFHQIQNGLHRRLLDLISLLITYGVDLQEELHIAIEVQDGYMRFIPLLEEPYLFDEVESEIIHMVLIVAYPASMILAMILQMWQLKDFSRMEWLIEPWEMAKNGFGYGHPIAVVEISEVLKKDLRQAELEKEGYVLYDAPRLFRAADIYPLGAKDSAGEELLRVMHLAENGLKGVTLDGWALSHVSVPVDIQAGAARAIEEMRSGKLPVAERRRQLRMRLGICSPLEEPEWQNRNENWGRLQ